MSLETQRGQRTLKGQSTLKGQDNRAQIVGQTNQSENRKCDDGNVTSKALFNCEMMLNGIIRIPMKDFLNEIQNFGGVSSECVTEILADSMTPVAWITVVLSFAIFTGFW